MHERNTYFEVALASFPEKETDDREEFELSPIDKTSWSAG